jgi:hypothetical protein
MHWEIGLNAMPSSPPSMVGKALLVTPALLGSFADKVGLHLAHLMVPGLVLSALIWFVIAQVLERWAKLHQSS